MLQLPLKTAQQKSGVVAVEAPSVSVEGDADRIGLDEGASAIGIPCGQPHGSAAQIGHHDPVGPPHPGEDSRCGQLTFPNRAVQVLRSKEFGDAAVAWVPPDLSNSHEQPGVQGELEQRLTLARFANGRTVVVTRATPRPARHAGQQQDCA